MPASFSYRPDVVSLSLFVKLPFVSALFTPLSVLLGAGIIFVVLLMYLVGFDTAAAPGYLLTPQTSY